MQRRIAILCLVFTLVLALSTLTGCARSGVQPVQEPVPVQSQTASTPTVAPPSSGDSNPQTDKVTVPDVVGSGMISARMLLGTNHLTYEILTDPPNADLPMDNSGVTVTKQDPAPDAIVDSGSTVTLTIKAK